MLDANVHAVLHGNLLEGACLTTKQAYFPAAINTARKSFTLVRVGPVTNASPRAPKKLWPSFLSRASCGFMPQAHARLSESGMSKPPAAFPAPSIPSLSPAIAHTSVTPWSERPSDRRYSTFLPPHPGPRTVTEVSPPESRMQGVKNGC